MAWTWWPQDALFHARGREKRPGGVEQHVQKGHFVLPYTIGDYLSDDISTGKISTDTKEFEESEKVLMTCLQS